MDRSKPSCRKERCDLPLSTNCAATSKRRLRIFRMDECRLCKGRHFSLERSHNTPIYSITSQHSA
jgi:hypothetical protein